MKHFFSILLACLCLHLLHAQSIVFTETKHDFGLVEEDSLTYTFYFENTGASTIKIESLEAPCGSCKGCVKVKYPEGYLKSGEKGEIFVKYVNYPHSGEKFHRRISLTFNTEDGRNPSYQTLGITMTTINKTPISEPDPVMFVPVIPGEKRAKETNLGEVQQKIGYPLVARQMNLEGTLIFRVLVDENGNYIKHLQPKSGHPLLIEAVEEELCKIRFTPAIQNDKPIKFWMNMPFIFKLN